MNIKVAAFTVSEKSINTFFKGYRDIWDFFNFYVVIRLNMVYSLAECPIGVMILNSLHAW